jgi:hypothetical protein
MTSPPARAQVPPAVSAQLDLAGLMAAGVEQYLMAASAPGVRQILLIDGPAVIGWRRWREIDDKYFGARARPAPRCWARAQAQPRSTR